MKHKLLSNESARAHGLAIAFFVILTLIVTWPLALHITDRVPGYFVADNYEYLWKMWWFKHALLDLKQSPLIAPQILYPQGFQLAHSELTPLHTVLGLPFTWLWGEIPTYNIFMMLSFVITGWATFALVRRLTDSIWAALLSGVLLSLTPYHVVRYGGIIPLASIEGIPLFFLGLELWFSERRFSRIAVAGLGFVLSAWASIYYAAGLLLLGPIYAAVRMRPLKRSLRDRQNWYAIVILAVVALITLVPLSIPYIRLNRQVDLLISLDEVDFWSASVTDYVIPSGLHPFWGEWVRSHLLSISDEYPQIALEFILSASWIGLLFAFYGWRRSPSPARQAILWLLLAAFILSLGPRLHLGRHPVVLPAPESIVDGFHRLMDSLGELLPSGENYQLLETDGITIPLPALIVRWLLPPIQGMRAWNRFTIFAIMGLSLIAGLGFDAWVRGELAPLSFTKEIRQRRKNIAGAVILSLALFELWPGRIPLQSIQSRPVDAWLAQQPDQFTIMELPLMSALSAPQLIYTRYHGKRTAFAYGTYFPYWYRQQYPELINCPDYACLDLLQSWDVKYLLLNRDALPEDSQLETLMDQTEELKRVVEFDEMIVYELQMHIEGD
ncbi:MAG: hypothetical protein JSV37_11720 [Anaerolineaceae bacterium]|nr:MAG: hypothetical protein JSV37_11720 [Anaerolineaceae bacterium]